MGNLLLFIILLIISIFTLVPIYLTIINILNLIIKAKFKENLHDFLTFLVGIIFTCILWNIFDVKPYTETIRYDGSIFDATVHTPIDFVSAPTVYAVLTVGLLSYILIRINKSNLPPLITVFSMSGISICRIFCIVFMIQISKNILENFLYGYFLLLPFNYIICSIRAEIEVIKQYKEKQKNREKYENKFLNGCNNLLMNINVERWPLIAIILSVPFAIILIIILCLFGQRPDAIIKAFTSTSDWTLSQMYSPPPVYYDAHYLCTVSLKGHRKLVKPIRYGIRRNQKIVVNRQLCIANAFEQLIEEKTPRFHKAIRYIYDKYGYPLSKHINTPLQADVTYIFMKPLEYIFLIILYLFDKEPENRIAKQYLPKIEE